MKKLEKQQKKWIVIFSAVNTLLSIFYLCLIFQLIPLLKETKDYLMFYKLLVFNHLMLSALFIPIIISNDKLRNETKFYWALHVLFTNIIGTSQYSFKHLPEQY